MMTSAAASSNGTPGGSPLSVLRRIATRPPPDPADEKCDMCAEEIGEEHSHIVDIESRQLMCACRGCYLLFTAEAAHLRYRAVPDRYLTFPGFALSQAGWDALEIPVGLAFFFSSSVLGKVVAFYPGPAGVAESELGLGSWDDIVEANPALRGLKPDVEALLLRAPDAETPAECYLVPIDACYELAGRIRLVWRGFDGGQDAREQIDAFFTQLLERSRPAPSGGPTS
ncbi:MAG: DUF5947 family protein [Nocardioidaceae bacterium]